MRALASALALVLAAAGCAGLRGGARGAEWSFPLRYEANQAVSVTTGGEQRDLVASVRRDGAEIEVTLFDPALAVPVLSGWQRAGAIGEQRHVDSIPSGYGERLVRLLADLHGRTFDVTDARDGEARGFGVRYRIEGLSGEAGCRFPRLIEVTPSGPAPRVRVETLDFGCGGPR